LLLKDNLTFPFTVERMEDEDDDYFRDIAKHQPFRLGHIMKVINVEPEEDDLYGLIVQVREGRRKGYLSGDRGDILLPVINKNDIPFHMRSFKLQSF
jgi:hypothetical protein